LTQFTYLKLFQSIFSSQPFQLQLFIDRSICLISINCVTFSTR